MIDNNKDVNRITDLVVRLRREYLDDPNIRTIGWGLAERGGELKDGICIIFYVNRKYPSEKLIKTMKSKPIPKEIEGFPTDVQDVKYVPSQAAGNRDEIKYDPLRGGVATSNSEEHILWFNSYGTLGILARDNETNAPLALSNWHVWADGGDEGDQIIQPGHPTLGDHLEALGKVAACGPLVTSLIEWEAPSPIATALYGAAAGAAAAAAASDYRDPSRRGQDNTPTDPGEFTQKETIAMNIEYPQLPLPGTAFHTKVKWDYLRETLEKVYHHAEEEERVNTQFLLGKMVMTNKNTYNPGDKIKLTAAIWDYQLRPCDAYHVVAHLIPHSDPDRVLRVVLQPITCPDKIPPTPPEETDSKMTCIDFNNYKEDKLDYKGAFEWLGYLNPIQEDVIILDWLNGTRSLHIPPEGIWFYHPPATKVTANVRVFSDASITMIAINGSGEIVGEVTSPAQEGVVHELTISGEGIVHTKIIGGHNEGVILSYCIITNQEETFVATLNETVIEGIARELPDLLIEGQKVEIHRCCFTGDIKLPPTEDPGKWDIHLTVQNINNVPDGTPVDEAAQTIGGHLLSSHTSPEVLGCAAIMLSDHVFDVI